MENINLGQGQKIFEGVLIEFSDVQGKSKKDNKDFHFLKFNIDLTLISAEGQPYTKLFEFITDPSVRNGQNFVKYKKVYCVFEIVTPYNPPKLIRVIQE